MWNKGRMLLEQQHSFVSHMLDSDAINLWSRNSYLYNDVGSEPAKEAEAPNDAIVVAVNLDARSHTAEYVSRRKVGRRLVAICPRRDMESKSGN
jgi:hypothetical protein